MIRYGWAWHEKEKKAKAQREKIKEVAIGMLFIISLLIAMGIGGMTYPY